MPVVTTSVQTGLPPADVLRILTDFSPARAETWPGVDSSNLTVHDRGETWADVTEGNKIGWERERYDWDAQAGTISAVTTESNLWKPPSRWDYRLVPQDGGTRVDVTLRRHSKGAKGALIAGLLPLIGRRMLTKSLNGALQPR